MMKIDNIKIFPTFQENPPKLEKLGRKILYYTRTGKFESEIIIDKSGQLIDGYTSYLIARLYDLNEVPVRYGRREVVLAAFKPGGKAYAWKLPLSFSGQIKAGDKVKVETSAGASLATVVSVEEYDGQKPEPHRKVIRLCRKGKQHGKKRND